ncbi:MAG: ABC transporter ATP-binding protein [Bacteroidetes bacterium]|nr:MAG: ABC transporter ATP-binding protein [Bacteroidota bacterium]
MSNILIKAENISKFYRLGLLGSRTLKEDIKNWWQNKTMDENFMDPGFGSSKNFIWALKNINFEVSHGEVLGFLGRNGAGKSTLLKIISRITLPTKGRILGKGRTASLLEVGTGFHGELTGRENIFLNGHILGMKKKEIESKFDEIVDFSGVEQFLDTPVKRYSSGMYVRLAFAVAAHLDPEILIVDEVLAVGDAEFQRKCIGKMKEVSSQKGKTILFVSHNMQAVRNLCHRAIVLNKGEIVDMGNPEAVIANYLKSEKTQHLLHEFQDKNSAPGNEFIRIKKVELIPDYVNESEVIDIRTRLTIQFEFWYDVNEANADLIVGVHLLNFNGDYIFDVASPRTVYEPGLIRGTCEIPGHFLNDGAYYISIVFVKNISQRLFYYESCLSFDVEDYRDNAGWYGKWVGVVRPNFPVLLQPVEN